MREDLNAKQRSVAARRAARLCAWTALASLAFAPVCLGWGDDSHRALTRGAIVALPEEIRPFFLCSREVIAEHSLDPDYMLNRTPAQKAEHFFDIDAYGPMPFTDPPHDREAAERKFGADVVVERGLLPWTVQREFDRLVKALNSGDWPEARLAAAHLSHFVADAYMPLHATANFDGQKTGNDGIHLRFEVGLIPRYHGSLSVEANPLFPVENPTEWAFREIARSWTWTPLLLQADTEARKAAALDSEPYYAELNRRAGPIAEVRLRDAATAIASFYVAAWEKAGRPALPPGRCVAVIFERDPALGAATVLRDDLLKSVATAMGPFDVVGMAVANAPKRAREPFMRFVAATDAREDGKPALSETGEMPDALAAVARALAQFPRCERYLILVSDGWAPDPSLLEVAKQLKAMRVSTRMFTFGPGATEQADPLAAEAGGKHVHLAEPGLIPDAVARDLAAEAPPAR